MANINPLKINSTSWPRSKALRSQTPAHFSQQGSSLPSKFLPHNLPVYSSNAHAPFYPKTFAYVPFTSSSLDAFHGWLTLIQASAQVSSLSSPLWQPQLSNSHLPSPSSPSYPGIITIWNYQHYLFIHSFLSVSPHYPGNSTKARTTSVLFTMMSNTEPGT